MAQLIVEEPVQTALRVLKVETDISPVLLSGCVNCSHALYVL
jgi:hypothetical protein